MSELDLTEQHARQRAGFAARVPIPISRDDSRDHADHRTLYVLGFGIAGAIVTNAFVFIYFKAMVLNQPRRKRRSKFRCEGRRGIQRPQ